MSVLGPFGIITLRDRLWNCRQNVGNGQSPTNPPVYNLDPSVAAKQMAALNSAAMARRATHGPSNDKSQSPSVPFATISSYQPPASAASMNPPQPSHGMPGGPTLPQQQAQPQQQQQGQQQQINNVQRQRVGFLQGISHFMSRAGNPLPPNITGVHVPNYDPNTSPWKLLEPGTELGTFRLSGKNIDIFKLFNVVFSNGGSSKVRKIGGLIDVNSCLPLFAIVQRCSMGQFGATCVRVTSRNSTDTRETCSSRDSHCGISQEDNWPV